jgi:hypothetical protein
LNNKESDECINHIKEEVKLLLYNKGNQLIKPLLNFENEGDFYMLYVFKRKKDQPEGERDNHQSVRTIKTYCVDSVEYLEKRYDEIKQLCEMFKARAYIHVQKQNHKDVSLEMMVSLAERMPYTTGTSFQDAVTSKSLEHADHNKLNSGRANSSFFIRSNLCKLSIGCKNTVLDWIKKKKPC